MGAIVYALLLLAAATGQAAGAATVSVPDQQQALRQQLHIPALTPVELRIVDGLSSKTAKVGDSFRVELSEPLRMNGAVVLPAGTSGRGEVVHAAKARAAGKAGELILAARFLDTGAVHVPLRSFRFGRSGESRADEAFVASMILTPAGYFMAGGEVIVQPGALASAKTAADIDLASEGATSSTVGGVP